jgi:hypothetical protein
MDGIGCVGVETVIFLQEHSLLQHRTRYWWLQTYRATPVGWKVVHDVVVGANAVRREQLYPDQTRLRVLI